MTAMLFVSCGSKDKEQEYNLGFIGPMTGDNANYGILSNNAAKLAIEHLMKMVELMVLM